MSGRIEHPFVPGARVAIEVDRSNYTPIGYKEAFVDKVFKTGRFTLRDSKQQWRPYEPAHYQPHWYASQTGDHGWRGGGRLRIWDEGADAEITYAIATHRRYQQFTELKAQIVCLRFSPELVTDEVIDWMRCVVLAVKPIKNADPPPNDPHPPQAEER
ncbi:MAG: hypothetical protein JWP25_4645 [Bradyrhizobium sp.]|nr:hypothetical protein [Bradyrhizobium sp.]